MPSEQSGIFGSDSYSAAAYKRASACTCSELLLEDKMGSSCCVLLLDSIAFDFFCFSLATCTDFLVFVSSSR